MRESRGLGTILLIPWLFVRLLGWVMERLILEETELIFGLYIWLFE